MRQSFVIIFLYIVCEISLWIQVFDFYEQIFAYEF